MKCVKTISFEIVRETAVASDAGDDNDFLISQAKFLESQVDRSEYTVVTTTRTPIRIVFGSILTREAYLQSSHFLDLS